MTHIFYSADREVCTYPKGNRFEWVNVYQDAFGATWIEGKGFWGCLTRIKLDDKQATQIRRLYDQSGR